MIGGMGNYEELKAALATATSEADQLNGELSASKSQVSALTAQVGDLEQQLADCQDGSTPVPPEPPSTSTTVFGSSDNSNVPGYNKVGSARKYYSGQIDASISSSVQTMIDHATHVLWVSFKALPGTGTSTNLEKFLKACANINLQGIKIGSKNNVKVMVTIFHEPENDNNNAGHNLTEYNNAYAQAKPIVDRYAYAALGPVRMNSQPADKNNKYWPTTPVDFDGWDCYYQGIQCPKNYDQTGAAVYSKVLASKGGGQGLTGTGKSLAIGETGVGRVNGGSATDSKRIQRAKEMRKALNDSGHTILASWWNAKNDEAAKCSNPTGCQFAAQSVADAWFKA